MKRFFKIFLLVLVIPAVLLIVFFGWTYINYLSDKNPDKTFLYPYIESCRIDVSLLTQEKSDLVVHLLLVNHMPLPITGDNLEYSFFMDSTKVMRSTYKKSITLKGSDTTWISLPMTVLTNDFKSVIEKNMKKNTDSVDYHLQVSFNSIYLLKKKINLNYKKALPLYYFPEVTVTHLQVDGVDNTGVSAQIIVLIENKNLFSMKSKHINYRFSIEGHEWIEGEIHGLTEIKAGSVTELRIPISISIKEMGKTVIDLLTNGRMVNYKFHLNFTMMSKNKILSDSKISVNRSGTIKSLIKSRKI